MNNNCKYFLFEKKLLLFKLQKGLVIGIYQKEGDKDPKLTSSGEKFDDRVQGKLSELVRE